MTKFEKKGFAKHDAFTKAHKKSKIYSHPDQNYIFKIHELSKLGDIEAFELLKNIIELSPYDEELLCYIGASYFEDWIQEADYKQFKDDIIYLLNTQPKWRKVIESSWNNPEDLENIIGREQIKK